MTLAANEIARNALGDGEALFASGQRGVLEADNGRNVALGQAEPMAWG